MNKRIYKYQAITMFLVYNALRFIALHSHSNIISDSLWKLWNTIGGDWAEGLLLTGTMCKASDLIPNEDGWTDVNLGV